MEKHHRLKNLDLFIILSHHMALKDPETQVIEISRMN